MAHEVGTLPIQKLAELLREKDDGSDLEDNQVKNIRLIMLRLRFLENQLKEVSTRYKCVKCRMYLPD